MKKFVILILGVLIGFILTCGVLKVGLDNSTIKTQGNNIIITIYGNEYLFTK